MEDIGFYKEGEFQDSRIGKIPRNWKAVELGDEAAAEIILGQSPPSATYNENGEGVPFLQGKMEFGEFYPSPTMYCSKPLKIAQPNDILLSVRAPVGDVNVADSRYCIGRGLAAIRGNREVFDYKFLFYYMKFAGKRLASIAMGSTFKAIRREEIERFSIPLPPLAEQNRIVWVLGVVDSVIAKIDGVIAKTEHLKKGLMQQLLTRGIGHKEYKDTPIEKIPKTWQVEKLGKVITYKKGKTPKPLLSQPEHNAQPYLNAESLRTGNFTQWAKVRDDVVKVHRDNILLIWDGFYCGDTFIDYEGMLSSTMIRISTNENQLNKRFLFYVLKTHFKELNTKISGMYLKHVNRHVFESLRIPIPPVSEQQEIVEILLSIDKKLDLERKEKLKLERIKQGLMRLLLTGKIRVKV